MNLQSMDTWAWPACPSNPDEFGAMMASLDQHLIAHDLRQAQRSLHAVRLVSRHFRLAGHPFAGRRANSTADFEPSGLLHRVFHWYSCVEGAV